MKLLEKSFELTWSLAVEFVVLLQPSYSLWLLTDYVSDDSLQLLLAADSAPVQSSAMMALLLLAKANIITLGHVQLRIRKYVNIVLKKFLSDVFNVWYHSRLK